MRNLPAIGGKGFDPRIKHTALMEPPPNGKGPKHQAAVEARFGRWPDRFWAKVDKTAECWLWLGATTPDGYGLSHGAHRSLGYMAAHRVAYELEVGRIPLGHQLDHLCRNPRCVNPAHLEPVTPSENLLRRLACPKGHPYTDETTGYLPNGWRHCLVCRRERWLRNKDANNARRRAKRAAAKAGL